MPARMRMASAPAHAHGECPCACAWRARTNRSSGVRVLRGGDNRIPLALCVCAAWFEEAFFRPSPAGHQVCLDHAGVAWTFGLGRRGRLGHGDGVTQRAPRAVPMPEGAAPLVDVAAGGAHTVFVDVAGAACVCPLSSENTKAA